MRARQKQHSDSYDGIKQQIWVRYVLLLAVCMLIIYVAFRVFSVVAFGVSAVGRYRHHTMPLVCPKTDRVDTLVSSTPYVRPGPKLMQRYLDNVEGNNLYANADLQEVESDGYPGGFERQTTPDNIKLTLHTDTDGLRYVRSSITGKTSDTAHTAWLPELVDVTYGRSYHFAYTYRSDTQATYSVQYKHADGTYSYRTFSGLPNSQDWSAVEGHFTIDDKAITSARVLVYPVGSGYVDIRRFSLHLLQKHEFTQGAVSIAFDDGWKSVYTNAVPLFDKYRLKASLYVVPLFMTENTDQYMSADQVRELQKQGHEIGIHSYAHCDMTRMTSTQLVQDTLDARVKIMAKADIQTRGGFAYPFGAHDQQTADGLRSQYVYLRTSDKGFNDYYSDTSLIKVQSVESNTTIQELQSWITYAKDNKQWLVLLYHRVGESGVYNIDQQMLDEQLKTITRTDTRVLTIADALKELGF